MAETCFPYSEKGRRGLRRLPRRRGNPLWRLGPRAWVLVAMDTAHRPLGIFAGLRRPRHRRFAELLLPRLANDVRLLADASGPLGPVSYLARSRGVTYRRLAPLETTQPAAGYARELKSWLVGFRGVATRYLPNYLMWHRFLVLAGMAGLDRASTGDGILALMVP